MKQKILEREVPVKTPGAPINGPKNGEWWRTKKGEKGPRNCTRQHNAMLLPLHGRISSPPRLLSTTNYTNPHTSPKSHKNAESKVWTIPIQVDTTGKRIPRHENELQNKIVLLHFRYLALGFTNPMNQISQTHNRMAADNLGASLSVSPCLIRKQKSIEVLCLGSSGY